MNIEPLLDRLVVRRATPQEKEQGGLSIPETSKEKPQEGIVVAVGAGYKDASGVFRPLAVDVGDRILFSKFAGSDVHIDGEEYTVLREDDVLMRLK